MNEFYSIAPINTEPIDNFQLKNYGLERVTMSVGSSRNDGYGGRTWKSTDLKSEVTSEDYDGAMAFKIIKVKPPYELEKLLNYHLEYYVNKGGEKDKFIKQIQYVVLPYIQKHYGKEKPHIDLTEQWILENKKNKMMDDNELSQDAVEVIDKVLQDARTLNSDCIDLYRYCPKNNGTTNKTILNDVYYFLTNKRFVTSNNPTSSIDKYLVTFTDTGRKLHKAGSIEIYNKSQKNVGSKMNTTSLNIHGNNNIVNNAGGDIHQSGITITVSNNQYQELKELGVDENQIAELKEIVSNHSQDKPTFKSRITKWAGAVLVSLASKGLIESIPKLQEFAHHLIP